MKHEKTISLAQFNSREYDAQTQAVVLTAKSIKAETGCTWGEAIKRAEAHHGWQQELGD